MTADLVVRGGLVVDGTGAPGRIADVAVTDGVIVEVGRVDGAGRREIDADGAVVAPGFVDIHTHYDGQATWDDSLAPSSAHGVTTVVAGNCGVGFAPVHPGDRQLLVEVMEGVEDLPGSILDEGLTWEWTSFPEYLDHLEPRRWDIDLATQVVHSPIRLHVMGRRGADREPATDEDIAAMGRLAAEGIAAGALGFSTSRTANHRTSAGDPIPSLDAARAELVGIAEAVGRTGTGVLQVVSDFADFDDEAETLVAMMQASGRPLSFSLAQAGRGTGHRRQLALLDRANAAGLTMRAQVAPRAVGILVGIQATVNPLRRLPTYRSMDESMPLADRAAALAAPDRRTALVAELTEAGVRIPLDRLYVLGDPPEYEPPASRSAVALAAAAGVPVVEWLVDALLADDGRALLYLPFLNYVDGNLDAVAEMLAHEHTVPGLGDGGAHVGTICDASFPTTLLTHWCRDRDGRRFDLPWAVHQQARATAEAVGLRDRGLLAPGYKADINVIDFDRLRLRPPRIAFDLPAGGRRLLQGADGYVHTFVSGVETMADGGPTGAHPGRLVRHHRPDPSRGARP
ncbi:MAG TPA: amidohydrolase family protein [Iamia sp.]|jgi:N-acyl-D-aspartate/D-glutamate deacylase|nr:amidohydrolase family protein [Iamia sp.]